MSKIITIGERFTKLVKNKSGLLGYTVHVNVYAEEHCKSPMYVSYRRAQRTRDFTVSVESAVSDDVISGLIDPTQALRGSWKRWQMPTDPHVTYTYRVRFVRRCDAGWAVQRLAFTVEGVDVFQLAVGNHVVVREVLYVYCSACNFTMSSSVSTQWCSQNLDAESTLGWGVGRVAPAPAGKATEKNFFGFFFV